MKQSARCDIIIPIWNQLSFTKDCLEHIVKNTCYPYRLILVDNASREDTRDYLRGFVSDNADKAVLAETLAITDKKLI